MSYYVYQIGGTGMPVKVIELKDFLPSNEVKKAIAQVEGIYIPYNPNDIEYLEVMGVAEPDEAIREALKRGSW